MFKDEQKAKQKYVVFSVLEFRLKKSLFLAIHSNCITIRKKSLKKFSVTIIKIHPHYFFDVLKKKSVLKISMIRKSKKKKIRERKSTSTDSEKKAKEKQGLYINLKNTSMEKSIYIYYCYIIV